MTTLLSPRRVAALTAVLVLLIAAAPASAAPSIRTSDHRVDIGFDSYGSQISISMQLSASNETDDGFNVAIWIAPDSPIFDPPSLVGHRADLGITEGDGSVTGVVVLADPDTGEEGGTLTIDAALTPIGEPQTLATRSGGNRLLVQEQTFQALSVTGSAALDAGATSAELSLDTASGTIMDRTAFENDPSSTVATTEAVGMLRYWTVDGMVVGMLVDADRAISYLEIAIIMPDGSAINGYDEAASVGQRSLGASVTLTSTAPGLSPSGGTATVDGDLARTSRTRTTVRDGDHQRIVTLDEFALTGSLVLRLDDGATYVIPLEEGQGPFLAYREQAIDGGRD